MRDGGGGGTQGTPRIHKHMSQLGQGDYSDLCHQHTHFCTAPDLDSYTGPRITAGLAKNGKSHTHEARMSVSLGPWVMELMGISGQGDLRGRGGTKDGSIRCGVCFGGPCPVCAVGGALSQVLGDVRGPRGLLSNGGGGGRLSWLSWDLADPDQNKLPLQEKRNLFKGPGVGGRFEVPRLRPLVALAPRPPPPPRCGIYRPLSNPLITPDQGQAQTGWADRTCWRPAQKEASRFAAPKCVHARPTSDRTAVHNGGGGSNLQGIKGSMKPDKGQDQDGEQGHTHNSQPHQRPGRLLGGGGVPPPVVLSL